ncbi:MAG: protein kinase domain-containing protein [Candidatus Polarisedimenticolia bacterium]
MALASGSRLGPYIILSPLAAGGMGEVYRARDTRLDREVAIKVLPQKTASDPEALARFEREARAVAALSHPNILAIHDFAVDGGVAFSVTEMLTGQTLRERMGGSPLPVRKAVDYALQIARGLAAAHDRGVIHRDLKPENLFVTNDGQIKILDFGLAKVGGSVESEETAAPTVDAATKPGTIMGTMGYMSPEQVRAQAVDHRTDIFSLGAVLYEMLSGKRAFHRDTAADTMSAILREDPAETGSSRAMVPPALDRIVRHCLEKSPAERFQSSRDLAFDLEAFSAGSGATDSAVGRPPAAARRASSAVVGMAACLLAGLLIGGGVAWWLRPAVSAEPPVLRFLSGSGFDHEPSSSRDGRLIAYVSTRDGRSGIWLKQHPGGDQKALTNGPLDTGPRVSPDGSQVLFVRDEQGHTSLFRIPVLGGEPRKVVDGAYGGDWSPDGRRVVFLRTVEGEAILRTQIGIGDISGQEVSVITQVDHASLAFPRWSPDGSTIAFTRVAAENSPNDVLLVSADGKQVRAMDPPPPAGILSGAAWSASLLIYAKAESFATSGATGPGRLILQDTRSSRAETLLWLPAQTDVVDVLGPGTVVMGITQQRRNLREIRLPPAIAEERWLTHDVSSDRQATVSPDGEWVLFSSTRSGNLDLWKLSRSTGAIHRLTDDPADDWDPAFSPDGRQVLWSSSRGGHFEIWMGGSDGTGARQLTHDGVDAENPTMTPDGQWVVYNSSNPKSSGIWKMRVDGRDAVRLVAGTWSTPDVSPDGRHVAFRTGGAQRDVLVARVSDGGLVGDPVELPGDLLNARPRWMPDGKTLLFIGTDDAGRRGVFAQDFVPDEGLRGTRRPLIDPGLTGGPESFGVTPDGTRLIFSSAEQTDSLMTAEGLRKVGPNIR